MNQTYVMDFDDLEFARPGLDMILKTKEHYPNFKVTLFMTPVPNAILNGNCKPDEYIEWADYLKQDWIEICPHGLIHCQGEMEYYKTPKGQIRQVTYKQANETIDAAEFTFKQLGIDYKKIWKSPHWQTSKEAYRALWERGYTVAVDPNQDIPEGGPVYIYNWSIDTPPPYFPTVKGHGHMWGSSLNTIHKCMDNMLKIPTDASFKFVSET